MRLITWNINGLPKALAAGLISYIVNSDADIICLQEIKTNKEKLCYVGLENYFITINNSSSNASKWGTAIIMKKHPLSLSNELDGYPDDEGRTQIINLPDVSVINSYAPNAGLYLQNLDKKAAYLKCLHDKTRTLMSKNPVIILGDLNIGHECGRPWFNPVQKPGLTSIEKDCFKQLLSLGFSDLVEKNVSKTTLDHLLISKYLEP